MHQYNLMCASNRQVLLIGFLHNVGCMATLVTGAWLSELVGRRLVVLCSLAVFIFAVTGIVLDSDLNRLLLYMFLVGATHGGRTIVAVLYLLELMPMKWRREAVCVWWSASAITMMSLTVFVRAVSGNLQMVMGVALLLAVVGFLILQFLLTESPQYRYERGRVVDFHEARTILSRIAAFNGVRQSRPYANFKFVAEAQHAVQDGQTNLAATSEISFEFDALTELQR